MRKLSQVPTTETVGTRKGISTPIDCEASMLLLDSKVFSSSRMESNDYDPRRLLTERCVIERESNWESVVPQLQDRVIERLERYRQLNWFDRMGTAPSEADSFSVVASRGAVSRSLRERSWVPRTWQGSYSELAEFYEGTTLELCLDLGQFNLFLIDQYSDQLWARPASILCDQFGGLGVQVLWQWVTLSFYDCLLPDSWRYGPQIGEWVAKSFLEGRFPVDVVSGGNSWELQLTVY